MLKSMVWCASSAGLLFFSLWQDFFPFQKETLHLCESIFWKGRERWGMGLTALGTHSTHSIQFFEEILWCDFQFKCNDYCLCHTHRFIFLQTPPPSAIFITVTHGSEIALNGNFKNPILLRGMGQQCTTSFFENQKNGEKSHWCLIFIFLVSSFPLRIGFHSPPVRKGSQESSKSCLMQNVSSCSKWGRMRTYHVGSFFTLPLPLRYCCFCGFKAQQCLGQRYGLKTLSTTRKPPFLTKIGLRLQVQASNFELTTPILEAARSNH